LLLRLGLRRGKALCGSGVFAEGVTRTIEAEPLIEIRREEITALDPEKLWIVASGPADFRFSSGRDRADTAPIAFFFTTASGPIVDAESIDMSIAFEQSRYGKSFWTAPTTM